MANIIKYAIDNTTKNIIHIDNADNGLNCNCNCAKCGARMVAVQGKSINHREWHFRHHIESDCLGGQETAIHKLAKQIIADNTQIAIPNDVLLFYTSPRLESRFETIIPDISVTSDGIDIHFEILVTHPVDIIKEEFYCKGQHKSIEINLKNYPYNISPEELKEIIINQAHNKRIIFWERKEHIKQENKTNNNFLQWLVGFTIFVGIYKLFDNRTSRKKRC